MTPTFAPVPWEDPPTLVGGQILVLDTETTGLPDEDPTVSMVEMAAVLYEVASDRIVARFSSLVAPAYPLTLAHERVLSEINKIPVSSLFGAPPAREVARRFYRWLAGVGGSRVCWTAYNVPFDRSILLRAGIQGTWTSDIKNLARDTLGILGSRGNGPRLEAATADLGVTSSLPAHRALRDAELAAHLLGMLYASSFRPSTIFLPRTPMAEWWRDHGTDLPIPPKGPVVPVWTRSLAAFALACRAHQIGYPFSPQWDPHPPPELEQTVPEDCWLMAYTHRAESTPAWKKALLGTGSLPLEGHPRGHLLTALRASLLAAAEELPHA